MVLFFKLSLREYRDGHCLINDISNVKWPRHEIIFLLSDSKFKPKYKT